MRCVTAGKVSGLPPGGLPIFKMIGICLESEEILIYLNGIWIPIISNVSTLQAVIYCKSENMQDFWLRFIVIHLSKVSSCKDLAQSPNDVRASALTNNNLAVCRTKPTNLRQRQQSPESTPHITDNICQERKDWKMESVINRKQQINKIHAWLRYWNYQKKKLLKIIIIDLLNNFKRKMQNEWAGEKELLKIIRILKKWNLHKNGWIWEAY